MPPFSPSHAVESLNTYFAALGISTRRVNEAIAATVSDLLAERLAAEIRGRFDNATPEQLLQVLAAVSPDAASESLPSLNVVPSPAMPPDRVLIVSHQPCTVCGASPVPGVQCCPFSSNQAVVPIQPLAKKPEVANPLCDLLPGGNKARKPQRSNK